jgi:hypothetical protein
MKAIVIPAAWAVLLLSGDKKYVTCDTEDSYTGPVAIISSPRREPMDSTWATQRHVRERLNELGYAKVTDLPFGKLLGIAQSVGTCVAYSTQVEISRVDRHSGEWRTKKFALEFTQPEALSTPVDTDLELNPEMALQELPANLEPHVPQPASRRAPRSTPKPEAAPEPTPEA